MTDDRGTTPGEGGPDRFAGLLEWLIDLNGDLEGITGVISADTLRNWRTGKYPKQRSTSAVAAVDRWARDTYSGIYPPIWAPGGLIALAGPGRGRTAPPAANSATCRTGTTGGPGNPKGSRPEARRRRLVGLASLTAIAAVVALIVIALFVSSQHGPGPSTLYARGGGPVAIRSCPALSCPAFNERAPS